jgi:hypothetical protein
VLIQSRPYNSSHRWSAVADLHTSPVIIIDIQQNKSFSVLSLQPLSQSSAAISSNITNAKEVSPYFHQAALSWCFLCFCGIELGIAFEYYHWDGSRALHCLKWWFRCICGVGCAPSLYCMAHLVNWQPGERPKYCDNRMIVSYQHIASIFPPSCLPQFMLFDVHTQRVHRSVMATIGNCYLRVCVSYCI